MNILHHLLDAKCSPSHSKINPKGWLVIVEIIGLNKSKSIGVGSQNIVEGIPFSYKIQRINSFTFVLYRRILCHSSNKKWPWHPLSIKV